jgi:hypothetical protein
MANPNIVNVTSIYGNTAYVIPSTTAATAAWTHNGTTALTGLTPAADSVNRVTQITVSNVTGSAASASIAISNNATFASGTPYYFAYQISVPANASLTLIDKTTSFYITENQSLGVITGTGSALNFVTTFEAIS